MFRCGRSTVITLTFYPMLLAMRLFTGKANNVRHCLKFRGVTQAPRAIHQRRNRDRILRFHIDWMLGRRRATKVSLCLSTPRPPICQSSQCIPITVHCLETIKLMDNPGILRRRRAPVLMDRSGVALPYSFVSFFGKRREKSWWGTNLCLWFRLKSHFSF